ncbi:ribonuclease III [uncultured Agrococcus sp.]|uniref:ribonuclease III n=1 Tax=uncultured Agrococcus sp. TaxID=382258 RepID=UPI0025E61616|nr:ribonuclease III [uncultured Agrococcus sp.]
MTDNRSLNEKLGVEIDPELLALALTHTSWAYENGGAHNERLEFLGDTILGQAITIELFRRFPDLDEGELSRRRAGVVSGFALAEVARGIHLGAYIRLGKGELKTGGSDRESILADTMEAVFGAAYLSVGHEQAEALVLRLVGPLLEDTERFGAALDPKTSLQELADRLHKGAPVYTVEAEGPDHARRFGATVKLDGVEVASGEGSSKRQAEMAAALEAWKRLRASNA